MAINNYAKKVWPIVSEAGPTTGVPKSLALQVERNSLRRRQDKLLTAVASVAAELLRTDFPEEAIERALNVLRTVVEIEHIWVFESKPNRLTPPELLPLHQGRVVSAIFRTASPQLKTFFRQLKIASALFVPITIEGTHWGHVGFEGCLAENGWTKEDINLLKTATSLIGAHITRERYLVQLIDTRDQAMRSHREAETANATKSEFLASMSHELRTPLNAILGFSDMMMQECFGPMGSPHYREYATDIYKSGTHLLAMINDLLDISKIEAGRMELEPELIDTQDVVESALQVLKVRIRERHQLLTTKLEPEAVIAYADERAFKQIIINLLSNAAKFAPECGNITVSVSRDENGDCRLVVEDNGPGIPKDKIGCLFHRFSQTNNRYDRPSGGTGLGLHLVRCLAELHGGRAWIESEEGTGTRAIVVLPALENVHTYVKDSKAISAALVA